MFQWTAKLAPDLNATASGNNNGINKVWPETRQKGSWGQCCRRIRVCYCKSLTLPGWTIYALFTSHAKNISLQPGIDVQSTMLSNGINRARANGRFRYASVCLDSTPFLFSARYCGVQMRHHSSRKTLTNSKQWQSGMMWWPKVEERFFPQWSPPFEHSTRVVMGLHVLQWVVMGVQVTVARR
jgi:hypothetical protein